MKQIKSKLKKLNLLFAIIIISTFTSCGNNTSQQSANAEGFLAIENEIKSEFGDNAFYTDLTITYNKSIGNIVGITVTKDPASLKMGQWNLTQNTWNQNSTISLEVPIGMKASDFMFQLNDKINLKTLGDLTEKSIAQLKAEKDLKKPTLSMAFVKFPKNGDITKTEYTVMLKPENGGTTFTFRYNLNGDLIKMDY